MTFYLIPGFRPASFTTEKFPELLNVLQEYGVTEFKFTSTQRLAVVGPTRNDCEIIGKKLSQLFPDPEKSAGWITSIHVCPGRESCKYGLQDGERLRSLIEQLKFDSPMPAKIKIGIAGCSMCCTEPMVRDIGLIAQKRGWKLVFGGNGGGRARVGDIIADGLTEDQAVELIERCLTVYQDCATKKMRTARFMEDFGVEMFIKTVTCKH